MRWLLRNVIRDLKMEARRRRSPGKVCRRPIIGGKPLPPNGTRFLRLHDFTAKLLDEIDENQEAGNVQLLMVGREGGEQNIDELRLQLGFKAKPKDFAPAPKKAPVSDGMAGVSADAIGFDEVAHFDEEEEIEEELPGDGELDVEEEALEATVTDTDELLDDDDEWDEESMADVPYTESELMGHSKDDLILVHKKVCPDSGSTGKTKQKLTDEILAVQAGH